MFEHLFGSYEESFEKLPRLLLEIKESILECLLPRSTKKILMIVQWYLGEFFGHLDLILKGSRLVSNIINIDGTHLCGWYDGKLLIIYAFDANNGIFSLTFVLVNKENNYN